MIKQLKILIFHRSFYSFPPFHLNLSDNSLVIRAGEEKNVEIICLCFYSSPSAGFFPPFFLSQSFSKPSA